MMAHDLKEEQRYLILDLIKERRLLYDSKHPNNRNVKAKQKAWKDIANICKAPESSVRIFWRYMRNEYQRYMRDPANNRRNFHYLPKLTFLKGFTKSSKPYLSASNGTKEIFHNNSSNSLNELSYKDKSLNYEDYNEEINEGEYHLLEEYVNQNKEVKREEFNIESMMKLVTSQNEKPDLEEIYNESTQNLIAENPEGVAYEDSKAQNKSTNNLCATIETLLTKHFQTEEDDNDLFLKMIGKKMKCLPETVKNRLQELFLQEVNNEIFKLNENLA